MIVNTVCQKTKKTFSLLFILNTNFCLKQYFIKVKITFIYLTKLLVDVKLQGPTVSFN